MMVSRTVGLSSVPELEDEGPRETEDGSDGDEEAREPKAASDGEGDAPPLRRSEAVGRRLFVGSPARKLGALGGRDDVRIASGSAG